MMDDGASRARNELNEETSLELDPPRWFREWVQHCEVCEDCWVVDPALGHLLWLRRQAEAAQAWAKEQYANLKVAQREAKMRQAYLQVLAQAPMSPVACWVGMRTLPADNIDLLLGLRNWDWDVMREFDKQFARRTETLHMRLVWPFTGWEGSVSFAVHLVSARDVVPVSGQEVTT